MEKYRPRKIQFKEVHQIAGWYIKVYTIAKYNGYDTPEHYRSAKRHLPQWLQLKNNFDTSHNHHAFLILHEGTEGLFTILCWWVGGNMLNTHIFLSDSAVPDEFRRISGDGLSPCVWELDVINFERLAWLNAVLRPAEPNFVAYRQTTYQAIL